MSLTLKVNGVDKTAAWFLPLEGTGEASFARRAGGSAPATFILYDLDGASGYRPDVGQSVELRDGATVVLAGTIVDVDEDGLSDLDTGVMTTITVVDSMALPGRVTYTTTYAAGTATLADVLADLVAGPLASFGVTLDGAQAVGATFAELAYVDASVESILNDLQTLTGWIWRLPPSLALVMVAPATVAVGFSLGDATGEVIGGVGKRKQRGANYANTVALSCGPSGVGEAIANAWPGGATVYSLAGVNVPASSTWPGVVNVDGVNYPMYLGGEAPGGNGIEWDYATNDGTLSFLGTSAAIGTGATTITLTYAPQYPFTVTVDDAAAVTADGGPWVVRAQREDLLDYAAAGAYALALLRIALVTPWIVTVRHREGLGWPGQTVPLSFAERDLSGTYMILSVRAETDVDGALVYTFECLEGSELQPTWVDYFKDLASGSSGGGSISSGGVVSVGGGGGTGGSGTAGNLAAWASSTVLGDTGLTYTGNRLINVGAAPSYELYETDQGANLKRWGMVARGGVLQIEKDNDTAGSPTVLLALNRSGELTTGIWKATVIGAQWGGTGINSSASTGVPSLSSGTWSVAIRLSAALGGTGIDTSGSSGIPTVNAGTWQVSNVLTSTRLLIAAASNAITSNANLTLSGSTLTIPGTITTPTTTDLTLSPTGSIVTAKGLLADAGYLRDIGSLSVKYRSLYAAELWVETLVAQDVMATIGGRIVVAPTTFLVQDLASGGGNNTIHVKHNNLLNGDIVRMEADGKVEWMSVDSSASGSAGNYTYTVTRGLDGASDTWYSGDAILNTGGVGSGFIDLYSVSGVLSGSGPTIVGNVRTALTYSSIEPRWTIGNMNGLYGYGATTFGAAFGQPSGANITIDPTNGFRVRAGSVTYAQLTGTTFTVGSGGGNRLAWDGTDITIVSANLTVNSSGVQIVVASASTPATTSGYTFLSSFASTPKMGTFGYEVASILGTPLRNCYVTLTNETASADVTVTTLLQAKNASRQAEVYIYAKGDAPAAPLGNHYNTDVWVSNNVEHFTIGGTGPTTSKFDVTVATGNTAIAGLLTVTGFGVHTFNAGGTGANVLNVSNTTAGAANLASFRLTNNSGSGYIGLTSSTYSTGRATAADPVNVAAALQIWHDTHVIIASPNGAVDIYAGGNATPNAAVRVDANGDFFPINDNTRHCGLVGNRWVDVYAVNGTIQTSDLEQKRDVTASDLGTAFLVALQPKMGRWKDGTDTRVHQWLVAQDVAAALGSRAVQFGGLYFDERGNPTALNYTAFVPPLIKGFQDHEARIAALERRAA